MEQEYPRFSNAEYARRHKALAGVMRKRRYRPPARDHRPTLRQCDAMGYRRGRARSKPTSSSSPARRCGCSWSGSTIFRSRKKIARDVDVQWGEHRGLQKMIEELKRRGAKRVGVMGPLRSRQVQRSWSGTFKLTSSSTREYIRLRTIKSAEELDWLRIGAAMSDAGLAALLREHGARAHRARARRISSSAPMSRTAERR